jgi:hypothetical protein
VKAMHYAKIFSQENNAILNNGIAAVFSNQKDTIYNSWYQDKIRKQDINNVFELFGFYNVYLQNQSENIINDAIKLYKTLAIDKSVNKYRRYICTASLVSLKNILSSSNHTQSLNLGSISKNINEAIKTIKVVETDEELITRYSEF